MEEMFEKELELLQEAWEKQAQEEYSASELMPYEYFMDGY
mgnify:CR=1 FL=1